MVRANLREIDPKTQTRRPLYVLTKNFKSVCFDRRYPPPLEFNVDRMPTLSNWSKAQAGDRLWQREMWAPQVDCEASAARWTIDWPIQHGPKPIVHFCSDNNPRAWVTKWRPSIHMPRWACRFEALITEVRIERLQAITEADAMAEGVERYHHGWEPYHQDTIPQGTARDSYACLWKLINGADSWKANPWIVAITYERIKP